MPRPSPLAKGGAAAATNAEGGAAAVAEADGGSSQRRRAGDVPAEELTLTFQAFAGQKEWLVSVPLLQRAGLATFYSVDNEAAGVQTRQGLIYPMKRGSRNGLWGLPFHCPERGVFVYGPAPDGSSVMMTVDLFADSCAMVHVAGEGFEDRLALLDGHGSDGMAAGSHRLVATGRGTAVLRFGKPGATYQVYASPLLGRGKGLEPNSQQHAKVVMMVEEKKPAEGEGKWMLEGPLRRQRSKNPLHAESEPQG